MSAAIGHCLQHTRGLGYLKVQMLAALRQPMPLPRRARDFKSGSGEACSMTGETYRAIDRQAADLNEDWAALPQRDVARLQGCIVHSAGIAAVHSDCRDAV